MKVKMDTFVCASCSKSRTNEMKGMVHYTAGGLLEYCWECIANRRVPRPPKQSRRSRKKFTKSDKNFLSEMGVKLA